MNTFTPSADPTLRAMRTQIALLVATVVAAGATELLVSATDDRDEAYWRSTPAPENVRAAAPR